MEQLEPHAPPTLTIQNEVKEEPCGLIGNSVQAAITFHKTLVGVSQLIGNTMRIKKTYDLLRKPRWVSYNAASAGRIVCRRPCVATRVV